VLLVAMSVHTILECMALGLMVRVRGVCEGGKGTLKMRVCGRVALSVRQSHTVWHAIPAICSLARST
jgi:hypothetical protein